MSHVDPNRLPLIALGEPMASPIDSAHLAECSQCASDLERLRFAVKVGRASMSVGVLLQPSPGVWGSIEADVAAAPTIPRPVSPPAAVIPEAPPGRLDPIAPAVDRDEQVDRDDQLDPGDEVDPDDRPRHTMSPRQLGFTLAGIAVAAAIIIALAIGWHVLRPDSANTVATANLQALPDWGNASGTAVVRQLVSGARQVQVRVTIDRPGSGVREAWLATSDLKHFVRLGVLHDGTGTFALDGGVDLSRYDLVDVSDQSSGATSGHSADSIVRGSLTNK
jgi:hypothetical protein